MFYNPFSLENKTILVTGASSGIGRAIAIELSKAGAVIILSGRNKERLNETFEHLKGTQHYIFEGDLTEENDIRQLVETVPELDGVVLTAGVNDKSLIKQLNRKKIEKVMGINLFSPMLTMKELLKQKKLKKGCSLVLISSISSTYSTISNAMYAASKGAIESFTRVSALELSSRRIRVNAIRPGVVRTPLLENYALGDRLDKFMEQVPLGRVAEPEDIAYGCIYLLSDAASWVTGSTLTIDGGITLR